MFFGHRRYRDALSGYIDGQLTPRESEALERHIESCEVCRAEIERLRGVVSALRDIPPVQAHRSFALTPEQASRPAAAAPARVPHLALGMRLASAGVAVALAVLVVADLGGAGGGEQRDEAAERVQFAPMSEGAGEEADSARAPAPSVSPDAALGIAPAATPTPEAADEEEATAAGQDAETASTAPAQEEAGQGEDGADALRIAQITLAAGLVALLLGSAAISRGGRRDER